MELADKLVERLERRQASVAAAESLTGGLVALRLTEAPGSGEVFRGALVAYLRGVKHDLLGVPDGPVVTGRCASAMASGVAALLGADMGLSTTGVAGPEDLEGQRPGTVFVACAVGGRTEVRELHLAAGMTPQSVRRASVEAVFDLALTELARPHVAVGTRRRPGVDPDKEPCT